MSKKVYITEKQYNIIKENIISENVKMKISANPKQVLIVKDYLDKTFKKGGISQFDDNGYPMTLPLVGLIGTDGNIIKNMDDKQLFLMLQDKFQNLCTDEKIRDRILIQIIKDWYYDKITKNGLLSCNLF